MSALESELDRQAAERAELQAARRQRDAAASVEMWMRLVYPLDRRSRRRDLNVNLRAAHLDRDRARRSLAGVAKLLERDDIDPKVRHYLTIGASRLQAVLDASPEHSDHPPSQ